MHNHATSHAGGVEGAACDAAHAALTNCRLGAKWQLMAVRMVLAMLPSRTAAHGQSWLLNSHDLLLLQPPVTVLLTEHMLLH